MSRPTTLLCGIATLIGIIATSRPADAGLISSFPVVIDTTNRQAMGSLGSARNTNDGNIQYIGCFNSISGYEDATGTANPLTVQTGGGCYALNTAKQSVSCSLIPGALAPMAPDSLIVFTWDANGNCTGLQVWTYSNTSPKQP
jgi:hypothetical protein